MQASVRSTKFIFFANVRKGIHCFIPSILSASISPFEIIGSTQKLALRSSESKYPTGFSFERDSNRKMKIIVNKGHWASLGDRDIFFPARRKSEPVPIVHEILKIPTFHYILGCLRKWKARRGMLGLKVSMQESLIPCFLTFMSLLSKFYPIFFLLN